MLKFGSPALRNRWDSGLAEAALKSHMGVSENQGVPYFGVLIIRILQFRVPILGPPVSGDSYI